ncbi:hypothetical protein GQ457_01G052580 [Hibiscus cannabinus]
MDALIAFRIKTDGGKLYMVGGIGKNGISRNLRVWELDNGGMWVEVERLPKLMCRKFMSVCYHNHEHVYRFWYHGMICVCCHTWLEVLYYKVSRRTWPGISRRRGKKKRMRRIKG